MSRSRLQGSGWTKSPRWNTAQRSFIIKCLAEFVGESKTFMMVSASFTANTYEKLGFEPIKDLFCTFRKRCQAIPPEQIMPVREAYLKRVEEIPIFHTINRLKILQDIIDDPATDAFNKVNALRAVLKETTKEAELQAITNSGKTQILNVAKYEITAETVALLKEELDVVAMIQLNLFDKPKLQDILSAASSKLKEITK